MSVIFLQMRPHNTIFMFFFSAPVATKIEIEIWKIQALNLHTVKR